MTDKTNTEFFFDLTEDHCINVKYINTIQIFEEIDKDKNKWYFLVVDLVTGQQYLGKKETSSPHGMMPYTGLKWPAFKVAKGSDCKYIFVNPVEMVEKRTHGSKFAHIKFKTHGKWIDFEYERYWPSLVAIREERNEYYDFFSKE